MPHISSELLLDDLVKVAWLFAMANFDVAAFVSRAQVDLDLLIAVRSISHATSFATMSITANYMNKHPFLYSVAWPLRDDAPCDH